MTECGDDGPAAEVRSLRITTMQGRRPILDGVSFTVARGEILGVVGESGSGKTTLGLALLNHCRKGLRIESGAVRVGGTDMLSATRGRLRQLRGTQVAYVPQDPTTALNPNLRIGVQIKESLRASAKDDDGLARLLEDVRLPRSADFLQAFPHQLSGGQLQRVALATAFANRPRLVVMDEPTTGLDVTTQKHVLETVARLSREHGVAAVYISHDIAVVASIADRVAVVYSGRIVEIGACDTVMTNPGHPYTRGLLRAVPDIGDGRKTLGIPGNPPDRGAEPDRCSFAPRCPIAMPYCVGDVPPIIALSADHGVRCLRIDVPEPLPAAAAPSALGSQTRAEILSVQRLSAWHGDLQVLSDASFNIQQGECLALVGESGSGKTTITRCVAGIHETMTGTLTFNQRVLAKRAGDRELDDLRGIQYVFQNPYSSLNPRHTIGEALAAAARRFLPAPAGDRRSEINAALDMVALSRSTSDRYPGDLSGGQRQRAAVARALIAKPALLICDEITSALDVSVQAVVIELLVNLQRERGLSLLFVTHNLALVAGLAQRILVMHKGTIVESGPTAQLLRAPKAVETQRLLHDAPTFRMAQMLHDPTTEPV